MSWKTDKDGVLIVIANILFIVWCALCFFGCATKQKAVDKTKAETTEISHTKTDETSVAEIKTTSEISGLTAYDFSQLISKWSLDYDGEMNDGFRFYFTQTDTGWEAGAEGKGKATAQSESNYIETRSETNWEESFDSLALISQSKFTQYESRIKTLEQSKTIEKKSTGFQAGTYITIGVGIIVLLFLLFLGWRMKLFRW